MINKSTDWSRFEVNPRIFECKLCADIFKKPITLHCGHSFCANCIYKFMINYSQSSSEQSNSKVTLPVPLCPTCSFIIWRPITQFRENLAITNLIQRFKLKPTLKFSNIPVQNTSQNSKHKILIKCIEVRSIPMPSCYNFIVFTTAFIDQILEQQTQSSYIVLTWKENKEIAITGKIFRPEVHHKRMVGKIGQYETVFQASFLGISYVRIKQQKILELKTVPAYIGNPLLEQEVHTSPLSICLIEEIKAINIQPLEKFRHFFEIYDTLNHQAFLAQIHKMIDERIFQERNNSQLMMYCALKLLKISQKRLNDLIFMFDDQKRMKEMNHYLLEEYKIAATDVLKVTIPGDYPSGNLLLVFIGILVMYYIMRL